LKVYITINDTPLDDLYMQLGDAGEAFFTEENTVKQKTNRIYCLNTNMFVFSRLQLFLRYDI